MPASRSCSPKEAGGDGSSPWVPGTGAVGQWGQSPLGTHPLGSLLGVLAAPLLVPHATMPGKQQMAQASEFLAPKGGDCWSFWLLASAWQSLAMAVI